MPDINATTQLVVGVGAAATVIIALARWVLPRYRNAKNDGSAIRGAILGRDPIIDPVSGKELSPALPGIGKRMEQQETWMGEIAKAVGQLAESHLQLARMDSALEDHAQRITKLEAGGLERVVARVESTTAWRAMEAATNATPDHETPPEPPIVTGG